ncbi:hypothetical protein KSP40_PGU013638 [Platanthera guangdongensis]|uniref:Uncharacterized protein n=1 Tax=Platanthera guangdongensis TaxID=2320717 RepID=A0ABR2MPL1_9ASPA
MIPSSFALRPKIACPGTDDISEDSLLRRSSTRFIHVSSAGVAPPEWPGHDFSKQPPTVPLSQELDFSLTYKLKYRRDRRKYNRLPYLNNRLLHAISSGLFSYK